MASLPQSLSALLKRSTIEDHEDILRACDEALKRNKSDIRALHIKVIALVKLDRHKEAKAIIQRGGTALIDIARFEYAYVLYKLGEHDAARDVASSVEGRRGEHIRGQLSYRLEDFSEAAKTYKELSDTADQGLKNEESDLRINSGAVDAQLEWNRQGSLVSKKKPGRDDPESFETAYNAACGCTARGQLGQAEVLLKRAKDLCASSEDILEEDKPGELLPISVQQLYVMSSLGMKDQVATIAEEIALQNVSDISLREIAAINKLAAGSAPINPYLALRILRSAPELLPSDKLFNFQSSLSEQNKLFLDLLASKFPGVANETARHLKENSGPTKVVHTNVQSAMNAAATAENELGKAGLKAILPLLEKRPQDMGFLLTTVQLYALTGNREAAMIITEGFLKRLEESGRPEDLEVRFAPGLVAVLSSLYAAEGRRSHLRNELAKAASYWKQKSNESPTAFRYAGLSLLESSQEADLQQAGEIFDIVHKQDPSDKLATAGLVAAFSTIEPSRLSREVDQLSPINRLTVGVDVAALEAAGIPRTESAMSALKRKRAVDAQKKPAKKRIRWSKRPKGCDPDKKPDPERWLPLRDRSTYKVKGKKGRQKASAATQGGFSDKPDIRPETPNSRPPTSGGGGGGGGAKKKKPKRK